VLSSRRVRSVPVELSDLREVIDMTGPCQEGYKCVWMLDVGTKLTCALPRCVMVKK